MPGPVWFAGVEWREFWRDRGPGQIPPISAPT